MHFSTILLPLITLSLTATVHAARFPHGKSDRRGNHPSVNGDDAARREVVAPVEPVTHKKAKRMVRKKKRGTACQVPLTAGNATLTGATTSTTAIGNNNWAGQSSATGSSTTMAASSTTYSPTPSATASSNSDWKLVADWVSLNSAVCDNYSILTFRSCSLGTTFSIISTSGAGMIQPMEPSLFKMLETPGIRG
jgi:hypothetical protein